jgi:hypothetical protein
MRGMLLTGACLVILLLLSSSSGEARQEQVPATATPTSQPGLQAAPENARIISPKPGQALQGNIPVVVDTTSSEFQSVELTFAYAKNPTDTWFLIYQGLQSVSNGPLVAWDTSLITDGDYDLRMVVTLNDGSQQTDTVKGVRVRNYTVVETDTPAPVTPTLQSELADTPIPTITPTYTPVQPPPTATPLPPNPAALSQADIWLGAGKGAVAIVALFAVGGLYYAVRKLGRKL